MNALKPQNFHLFVISVSALAGIVLMVEFIFLIISLLDAEFVSSIMVAFAMVATTLAWRLIVRRFRVIHWTRAGTASSLTLTGEGYRHIPIPLFSLLTGKRISDGVHDGDGPLTLQAFSGTVDGVPVRVTAGGREFINEPYRHMYTVIEAELDRDTHEGAIIASLPSHAKKPFWVEKDADFVSEEFAVAATSEELARAILSGRARDALRDCGDIRQVYAGDITAVYEKLDDLRGKKTDPVLIVLDAHGAEDIRDIYVSTDWAGSTSTVTHLAGKTIVDPDELEAQIQAVAAVAQAFDEGRRW